MINGNTITFDDISADRVKKLTNTLTATRFWVLDRDFGWLVEGHDIKANMSYASSTLTIVITSKPFYVTMELIEEKIQGVLKGN